MAKKNGESESKPTRTPGRRRTDKTAKAAPASAPETVRTTTVQAAPASAPEIARVKMPGSASLKNIDYSPSPEEVQRRAYELYIQRGGGDGRDLDDWYEAERQLRTGRA